MSNNAKFSGDQLSGTLDYLYRRGDSEQAEIVISNTKGNENLELSKLYDENNQILLSTRYELRRQSLNESVPDSLQNYQWLFTQIREKMAGEVVVLPEKHRVIALYPVPLAALTGELRPSRIGILWLEYDVLALQRRAWHDSLQRSLELTVELTALCVLIWLFFDRTITQRAARLVAVSQSLMNGQLQQRVKLSGSDELAKIATAFNQMADQIQRNTEALKTSEQQARAIALQQADLRQQVQVLNRDLEAQVQERTARLQQALEFEALLQRITDQVRSSLDEAQILQQAVEELAIALKANCCDTTIYSEDRTTVVIKYEYNATTATDAPVCGTHFVVAHSSDPQLYVQFLQGQYCLFCLLNPNVARPTQERQSILACPIQHDQGVLGDIWLFKAADVTFTELEVQLVQQVANQCAIALRQSRLYQAAQTQVRELARLNQLKDDFLNTVSHELRTPIASIKMATQMLETSLKPIGLLDNPTNPIHHYLQVLREEGDREIELINDLLDLAQLDAEAEPLKLTAISLQFYIPFIAEPLMERISEQQQQLVIQIPDDLPSLHTDLFYLERILTELLQNACKYTPTGEMISVAAQVVGPVLEIRVQNSGVEIPAEECDRIFDKFYRIPNNDPWKYGGTGLGLALVKKLTERLGGQIQVKSAQQQTTFILKLVSGVGG